jgi:hypothetical protein
VLEVIQQRVQDQKCVEAVQSLQRRVLDWKGHDVSNFGRLLLFGEFDLEVGMRSEADLGSLGVRRLVCSVPAFMCMSDDHS